MKKEKDEVIRCGYKLGGGAERDQGLEENYAKGGKASRDCSSGRVKRDVGGLLDENNNPKNNNIQNKQMPMPNASSDRPRTPININYEFKKGGTLRAKAAVKEILKTSRKEEKIKAPKPSSALIESISIMPTCHTKNTSNKIREEKAIGGAAKIRQGTFGLKGKPLIKR